MTQRPTIARAVRHDGAPLSPIFWEAGDGRIVGPAVPEFFIRDSAAFWISATFQGQIWFVREDRLRSKKAVQQQQPLREVELIREPSEQPLRQAGMRR